jgi:RNA-directed DNA polymerase
MKNALLEVISANNLNFAWKEEGSRLKSSSYGIDRVGGKQFHAEKSWRIPAIRKRLQSSFLASPLVAIAKPKESGGHRIICVPTIEDRLLQFSILFKIRETLKERKLLNTISYGLVAHSQRTVQDARMRATQLRENGKWVYKTDIEKFFDNIPRIKLAREIQRIVPYKSLHDGLIKFSNVEIGDGLSPDWEEIVAQAGIVHGRGVRQGMPLSPYFAGMILRDLDLLLEKKKFPVIRYVDDIIGFFDSKAHCVDFDGFLREQLIKLNLQLGLVDAPNSKTKIYDPDEPVDFVGMQMSFDGTGKCKLSVSEKTIQKIESRFAEMSNLDKLLQKKITLPHLGARLESMKKGYVAAYHGATNMSDLKLRIETASSPIIGAVLEGLFGPAMKTLGKKERRFLGID